MPCENALSLIPSYLDGELSEEQAAPLRQHLMSCPTCREVAKSDTALKRWFVPEARAAGQSLAPPGFAARVARRAFAGDTGELESGAAEAPARLAEGQLFRFVMALTAAAALVLVSLSAALRFQELPSDDGLRATEAESLSELLRDLDRENRQALELETERATELPGEGAQR